jgi:hypothetical protein
MGPGNGLKIAHHVQYSLEPERERETRILARITQCAG